MPRTTAKIKIVFLADTHLGFDFPIRPRLQRRRRGDDFFKNYHMVLRHARGHADLLIHGGDLFFRSRVHPKIIDMAYEPLLELADSGVPVVLVPGNHERGELPISLSLSHPNIFVFDQPRSFSFNIKNLSLRLTGFPFQRGDIRTNFQKVLSESDPHESADIKLLCLHHAIEGATVGPADYTFRHSKDTIRMADLPDDVDAVLAGHIHRHQILHKRVAGDGTIPVIYPGSIERTAFAEKDEDKGFVELSCDKSGIQKIEFIKLPARPMVDLHIDQVNSEEALRSLLASACRRIDPDAVVRIKLGDGVSESMRAKLSSAFLREVFPATMNVQLSSDFFRDRQPNSRFNSSDVKRTLLDRIRREAPNRIGVYLFKDRNGAVIYVGKSVNLKQRMASYFYSNGERGEKRIGQMIAAIRNFAFIETETELLSLLLEDALIKKYLPPYNVRQKEYNEYRYLLLTTDAFPTLKMMDHNEAQNGGEIFGPFKDQYFVHHVLDLIYRHLHLRQCHDKVPVQKSINFELGLCTGPCRGAISEADYTSIAQRVRDFLRGNEAHMVGLLTTAMNQAAEALEFEKAAAIKKQIDFCRAFAKRQRFIEKFRTSDLTLSKNGNEERYTFSQGQLIYTLVDGHVITEKILPKLDRDSRFILDRANIVFRQLCASQDFTCSWSSHKTFAKKGRPDWTEC